jgi:hypothetical protein
MWLTRLLDMMTPRRIKMDDGQNQTEPQLPRATENPADIQAAVEAGAIEEAGDTLPPFNPTDVAGLAALIEFAVATENANRRLATALDRISNRSGRATEVLTESLNQMREAVNAPRISGEAVEQSAALREELSRRVQAAQNGSDIIAAAVEVGKNLIRVLA